MTPDRDGDPAHARHDFGAALDGAALDAAALDGGGPVVVASGRSEHVGARPLRQRNAAPRVARLRDGETVRVPPARWVHVFVTRGAVIIDVSGVDRAHAPAAATATARVSAASEVAADGDAVAPHEAVLDGGTGLSAGDAVRRAGAGAQRLTATPGGAEVLRWEMHATLGEP